MDFFFEYGLKVMDPLAIVIFHLNQHLKSAIKMQMVLYCISARS